MKFKSIYISKIIVICNVTFALLLLLSTLAYYINPQQFWLIAFISLAYPFFLLINLIFFIYWIARLRRYALISGLTILLGWNIIFNYFGFNFKTNPDLKTRPANSLRVMTFNVDSFEDIDKPGFFSYQKILNLIRIKNPDIITFEEFNVRNQRFRFCDSLTKILNSKNYYFEPFIKTPNDSTGLAIFSKLSIINHNIIKLSDEQSDNQGILIDVKSRYGIVRVYCFHLQSIMLQYGDFQVIKHKRFYKRYLKYTIKKFKTAYIKRAQQALMIKKQTEKCTYPYIFAGDFNDTPNSYTYHIMSKGLKNAFREKGSGIGITYNQKLPIFQIDYILASPQFDVMNYQIIKQKIADHYPVCADLLLR